MRFLSRTKTGACYVKRREPSQTRVASGIVGGALLGIAALWLAWLLATSIGTGRTGSHPNGATGSTGSSQAENAGPVAQVQPLLAAGIQLGQPSKNAVMSKQQAMFFANELEADAASKAQSIDARYVTVTYAHSSTSASHPDLSDEPVWLITFHQIPFVRADTSVDAIKYPHATQNLYVFLAADSGKELFSVWA